MVRLLVRGALALALLNPAALADDGGFLKPGPRDKCPVCGMFVAKYPDWVAEVRMRDGTVAVFDGAKDLFKFLLDVARYQPSRSRADVQRVFVTDYYAVRPFDARAAYFVVGSDVYGPMGHELVPFERLADAEEFLRDHRGRAILRFGDVDGGVVEGLD
jgi:nitrous oxide reductase accessory protein NosL